MLTKLKNSFRKKGASNSTEESSSSSENIGNQSITRSFHNLIQDKTEKTQEVKETKQRRESEGYLLLHLIGASNLPSADANGLSDPFCSIKIKNTGLSESEEQYQKTEVIKKELNPHWNSFFFFDVIEFNGTFVEFEVYDYDRLSKNDLLGGCAFNIKLLTPCVQTELSIGLDTKGTVDCNMMYIPQTTFGFLMKKCIETKNMYIDRDFPATTTSICHNETFLSSKGIDPSSINWMRPKEFCKGSLRPELFLAGVEPADIRQGKIGDCYFLGAIAVAALHPKLIKSLFIPSAYNEYGIYQIKMFYNGIWQEVIIDDYVPVVVSSKIEQKSRSNYAPLFVRSTDLEELWVILLEKAYAKLHGSYEDIEGAHSIREAFEHLTGGWSDAIELAPYMNGKKSNTDLFNNMLEWKKNRHLMATSTASDNDFDFENYLVPNDNGIVPKHAYSILDVRYVSKEESPENIPYQLVKLRNTWGKTEWKGKFADDWEGWTDALAKKLNQVNSDDGSFWMSIDDYVEQFNYLYICRVPITDGFIREISAIPVDLDIKKMIKERASNAHIIFDKRGGACEWNQELYQNAGGQIYFKESFFQNPQFRLTIDLPPSLANQDDTASISDFKSNMIRIIVSIRIVDDEKTKDAKRKKQTKPNPLGLYVFRNRKAQKSGKYALMDFPDNAADRVGETNMKKLSRDAVEIYLPRPNPKKYEQEKQEGLHDYTIVASRWYPNTEGSFAIQVCSDYKHLQFEAIDGSQSAAAFCKKVIKSEWNGVDSCGAHWQTSTFSTNPKFLIQCKEIPNHPQGSEDSQFIRNAVNIYVESENGKIPFFPYVVSLVKFKKWMQQSVLQPITEDQCVLFPPNGNEFFTIRHSFDCELACRRDKPVSYLLILGTPYKMAGKFTIVVKAEQEITIEQVSL
ncbi:predicted protein [Naegleria gruberi]|uniref:Predicted protein n=1 Tax=Naegleria gruberi TaxID=5762 RepID=D2V2W6_NAEGR|nr:uncharacterized protein NAEGRDRAFT_63142 [Naegleria gruberi]EFC48968.1 predicted protein [Naegleria gruberi]|eukprot:XP_002681712.1 predicted protein [Naegleria gruberi strain NEG-M]